MMASAYHIRWASWNHQSQPFLQLHSFSTPHVHTFTANYHSSLSRHAYIEIFSHCPSSTFVGEVNFCSGLFSHAMAISAPASTWMIASVRWREIWFYKREHGETGCKVGDEVDGFAQGSFSICDLWKAEG